MWEFIDSLSSMYEPRFLTTDDFIILMLSDTSLFIKYFSFYGCFEGVLDSANEFKTVT